MKLNKSCKLSIFSSVTESNPIKCACFCFIISEFRHRNNSITDPFAFALRYNWIHTPNTGIVGVNCYVVGFEVEYIGCKSENVNYKHHQLLRAEVQRNPPLIFLYDKKISSTWEVMRQDWEGVMFLRPGFK